MTLIKCSDCGKDYSDLLSICKYCKKSKEIIINSNDNNEILKVETENIDNEVSTNKWNFKEKAFMIALIIIIAANFFNFDFINLKNDSNNENAKFTECECKEIFQSVKNEFITGTSPYWTKIAICYDLYVQERKSNGSLGFVENINPCYKEAYQYGAGTPGDFAIRAGECNCREGFISIPKQ